METTGQIDHAGEVLRAAPARVTVVPDVLVDAQDLHALEPGRIACGLNQDGLDLGPERVPSGAELPGQTLDRRSLGPELADRPPDRARAQQPPRSADLGVLLDERDHRADVLEADPAALAPPNPHRPAGPGRIDYLNVADLSVELRDGLALAAVLPQRALVHVA